MGGVHAAEVGQAGGRVRRRPTQDVAQLRGVGVDGVPRHQELEGQTVKERLPTNTETRLHGGAELAFTASGTSLTAPGSSLTSRVTSATMASFLNLEEQE